MMFEAFYHGLRSGGLEDFFQRLMEKIAENDVAIVV